MEILEIKKSFNESDIFYEKDSSVNSHYSNCYHFDNSRSINKSNSYKEIGKEKKKVIKIGIKRSKSLDKIDNYFNFSFQGMINGNKEYESFEEESISLLSHKNENFFEESFEIDDFFKKKFKYPTKDDIFQRCNYLYNGFQEIQDKKLFKKTNIRCFLKEEKKNEKCNCIPLIEKKKFGLFFFVTKN